MNNQHPQIPSQTNEAPVSESPAENKKKHKTPEENKFIKKWKALIREKRSFRFRLALSASAALAFAYTVLVFGPYEIYIKNMD